MAPPIHVREVHRLIDKLWESFPCYTDVAQEFVVALRGLNLFLDGMTTHESWTDDDVERLRAFHATFQRLLSSAPGTPLLEAVNSPALKPRRRVRRHAAAVRARRFRALAARPSNQGAKQEAE